MPQLKVKIPSTKPGSYTIQIGAGLLDSIWQQIESEFAQCGKFIITDEMVADAGHLKTLLGSKNVESFVITPAGEVSKHIETVVSIIEAMEKASLGRDTVIVGLGGGTVGDIAGFAAAIFKRGVNVVQIPTTTVSQADSSVGGKTGVDSTVSKNAFGAFWHPAAVYIDVETLKTLDDRQYRAGLVESIKHALIADEKYFEYIEKNIDPILARETEVLERMAYYNCSIKASVVEADPTEKNQRRMLNYGHTIGHAAESVSGFDLLHGEAIAIGIIGAGLIEIEKKLSDEKRLDRVRQILLKIGVPVSLPPNLKKKSLIEALQRDKKAVAKWPKFVLTNKIGSVHCPDGEWAVDVDRDLVEKILDDLLIS